MAKQAIVTKQTNLVSSVAEGQQLEQTYTVDDSFLPSPSELREYLEINPAIVEMLIDASKKEQEHRHLIDKEKIKIINKDASSIHTVNKIGMTFAFLIMSFGLGISAYLIYRDKEIVGSIFAGSTILTAACAFLNHVRRDKNIDRDEAITDKNK